MSLWLTILSLLNDALYDALPYALVCLGVVWTAKHIRFPDLTCSGTFVLGGALAAVAVVKVGLPWALGIGLALLGGAAGGLLTAFFYLGLRMDRILSGILSAFVLYSVNLLLLTPTVPYQGHETMLTTVERLDRQVITPDVALSWHPWALLLMGGLVLTVKLAMDGFLASEKGLALRALEDEEAGDSALLRQGMSPTKYRLLALAAGNAVIGLAGALVSFKEGAANANRGFDVLVTGLIAFLVGMQIHRIMHVLAQRLAMRGWDRVGNILRIRFTTGAALGAVAYFFLLSLSQRVQIDSAYAKILLAILVAVSVSDPSVLRRMLRRNGTSVRIPETGDSLLSVQNLHYRYSAADTETLRGIQLTVRPGTFVRVRGGNGSGKTTFLRVIAGFLDADQGGRIVYAGQDLTHSPGERLRKIAYVDQNAHRGVVSILTTQENLALASCGPRPSLWRRAMNPNRIARLAQIAERSGVPTHILPLPAAYLSGGQKQVVNLLTLLAREDRPKLVLLDEPANNLDVSNQDRCRQIIASLREAGVSIVLISHTDLPELLVDNEIDLDQVNQTGTLSNYLTPAVNS
jgi:putative tryptophan/tyrosine transport system permease protein